MEIMKAEKLATEDKPFYIDHTKKIVSSYGFTGYRINKLEKDDSMKLHSIFGSVTKSLSF